MITVLNRRNKTETEENIRIPELYREKLLHYAESFRELAKSLESPGVEENEAMDRRELLEGYKAAENRLLISHNLSEVARIMTGLAGELADCRPIEERESFLLSSK